MNPSFQDSGFIFRIHILRVQDSGFIFRIQDMNKATLQDSEFKIQGSGFRIQNSGFRIQFVEGPFFSLALKTG